MFSREAISIETTPRTLSVSEFIVRQTAGDVIDQVWRFEAIVRNESSNNFTNLEYALRFYDRSQKFLGLDKGYSLGWGELAARSDKSISFDLSIPCDTSSAVFSLKAKKDRFTEKHELLIFGILVVIGALIFLLAKLWS